MGEDQVNLGEGGKDQVNFGKGGGGRSCHRCCSVGSSLVQDLNFQAIVV